MLIVLLNWLYIFITTYITGQTILILFNRLSGNRTGYGFLSAMISGFAFVTVFSGYFSLFRRVGPEVNILLIIICILDILLFRKDHFRVLQEGFRFLKTRYQIKILREAGALILFFVIIYFSAYGEFHSDSGLYHAQSIRWIEEYGVVKGLGLLQNRFGYNSAFFSVSALYSFAFLGQSLHCVNGFMAALVTIYAWYELTFSIYSKKHGLHILADAAPVLYTFVGGIELISPTTDPILLYLFFAIAMLWCRGIERDDTDVSYYSLLCVLTCFLVSVKLSVGVLVLLVLQPAVVLIKEKRIGEIIVCILSGIISVLPYFIRSVIITGWLIYPSSTPDLFSYPWKIPVESIEHDAAEITTWARYVRDTDRLNDSILEWAPVWWEGQTTLDRFLSFVAIASFITGLLWCVSAAGRLIKNNKKDPSPFLCRLLFLEIVMLLGFLFWFLSAPLIRYGYLYLLLLPLITCGVMIYDKGVQLPLKGLFAILMILFMLYPIGSYVIKDAGYIRDNWSRQYAVFQKDYPEAEVKEKEYCGFSFYYPVDEGTPVWYKAFPSVLYEDNLDFMVPMGDSLEDGFMIRQ
ncbi:MAG: hypothetical protein K5668_06230 [Lachnospiraceae bacterium]|nr:hypothetical protein [Lachnospiraceae bacterium]